MSYYIDITSPYIWILLYIGQALSYHVICALHNMFWGRKLLQHRQWNYRHSHLIATSANPLSFHVLYNLPFLSRQEHDMASLCPFPTLGTCLHHRIWWRSCSTAPTIAVLCNQDWRSWQWLVVRVQSVLWLVQLHTKICSHVLASWTVYYYWPHVFFFSEVLLYSVSAPVHDLVTVGSVC